MQINPAALGFATMNLGAPELIIVLLLFGLIAVTVVGLIRAGQNGDTGWLAGIIAGWFFGLGWLVAIIYLLAVAPGRSGRAGTHAVAPTSMPATPSGWHPDPSGRHEHRYWDGSNWTDTVSDQGATSSDPLGPPG